VLLALAAVIGLVLVCAFAARRMLGGAVQGGGGQINSIALSDGSVVIEFEGVLKSASGVTGPYAPVAGATSPYSVAPDQSAQFYIAE